MTDYELQVLKANMLGGMYDYLGQDDEAYAVWIMGFPDEPTEEDLMEIAGDSAQWRLACELFGKIVKNFELVQAKAWTFFLLSSFNTSAQQSQRRGIDRCKPNSSSPLLYANFYCLFEIFFLFPNFPAMACLLYSRQLFLAAAPAPVLSFQELVV